MHSHLKPVAVCGIALRLPGGINNAGDLWDALQSKRDMRTPVPESRYCKEGFSNVHGSKSAIETQDGYFLDQDLACFDSSLFSLTEEEVKRADPQQRILLELVKECLENAGEINYRGRDIGCYVGTFGEDWLQSQSKEDQHSGGYIMSGQIDLMLANRVSYENDLRGPSMVIKTGCSASLIALHEACRAIQMNDCDGAIVAGTNLILGPSTTIAMTSEGILSPEGSCKTFDSAADGFARGEAITAIYVQDLDKAIEQGLPIRAVIPNTGVNCDGRSRSILQPSLEAQVALMRKVYGDLGLDPARTAYVECHGTGTPTGDPIEAAAVGQVFGRKGVYIGSIKPNIGHSEGASGISSLIKSVLMLEKGMIAPNIKFCSPNPKIAFEEHQLQVPDELLPWPRDRDMRVSINSFGIGGSNAHVIIEHPYTYLRHSSNSLGAQLDSPQLLLMSTSTPLSLQKLSASYEEYIQDRLASLPGLAYTLANRREHHRFRTFAVCSSNGKLHIAPSVKVSGQAAGITLVFSGQGAQWAQMGCDLLEFNTAFLQAIKAMDQILESLQHPPEWSVEAELRKPSETSRLDQAEIAQPLCTAVQIALLQVLYTGGVQPSAVVGHSSGEIAAAYAAGAICMEEAIIVAYYRGFIAKNYVVKGSMAAIGLDSKTTRQFLKPGVVVACKNSPSSTTISGDNDALESALEEIKRRLGDVFARKLKVDIAYHSHHMQKVSTKYLDLLQNELRSRNLCRNNPTVPIFSSVWDQKITSAQTLSPEYWVANLVSPVEFNRAVEKLLREHANNVLLEVGPHSSLAGPLRQTCSAVGAEYNYCATLKRYSHGTQDVLSTFGTLYQHGIDIDFSGVIPEGTLLTDLPTYPWNHSTSYWYECRLANAWRLRKFGHHELLGLRVFQSTSLNPTWRILLNIEDVPWLADHKVKCDIVFPFAAYVSMAGEALRQMSNIEGGYSIRDFAVVTAMVLDKEESLEIVTALHSGSWNNIELAENNFAFTISSYTGSTWIQHCRGVVGPPRAFELSLSNSDHTPRSIGSNTWYSSMARLGLEYGPSFQKIDHLATSTHEMLAFARLVGVADHQSLRFPLHPTTIDASFQVGIAALAMGLCRNFSRPMVPTYLEQLDVLQSTTSINCRAFYSAASGELSIDGVGTNGESCFRLRGMRFKELLNDHLASDEDQHGAARLEWVPHHESKEISNLIQIPSSGKREKEIVEELALLCVVESVELLKDLEPSMSHLLKYRAWLSLVAEQAFTDKHPVLERTSLLVCLPAEERTLKMRQLSEEASSSPLTASFTEALLKVRDNIQGLFVGNVDALELLLRNDNLARIYDAVSFDYSNFICSLCDAMPNLRILEIGAGTGGTTELILRGLQRNTKFPRYAKYTFTDISAGFFPSARQRFAGAANMEFKVFDISLDSSEQGFEPGSYDLILAANVIHATSNLAQTLGNLRPLLAGCGQLVLTEFCTRFQAPNYIYGNFSGWWLGEADDRKWEPYVDIARWDKELKAAGFSGASNTVLDAAEPWQYCATIVAHNPAKETKPSTTVSIIGENSHTTVNLTLVEGLEHEGLSPCFVALNDCSTLEGDVIVSLDLEMYFFEDISDERFGLFQKLCRTLKGKTVLWLMPPTQICCDEPRGSQRLGVIRTARYELNTPMSTLEIDVSAPGFSKFVAEVFYKVRSQEDCGTLDPDREFAVHEGNVKVGRYRPFHLRKEIERSVASRSIQARLLQNAQPLEKSVSKGRSSPNGVVVESAERLVICPISVIGTSLTTS